MKKKRPHYRILDRLFRKTNLALQTGQACSQMQNLPYEMRLPGYPVPDIRPMKETLDLLEQGKSLCRFGDGEFSLIFQKKMMYEAPSAVLSAKLMEVLHTEQENVLIGIPGALADMTTLRNQQKMWWLDYFYHNRCGINQILDFSKQYHSTDISRYYMNSMYKNPDDLAGHYERLIEIFNKKKCVLICGEHEAKRHDFYAQINIVERILAPTTGAFSLYTEIVKKAASFDNSHILLISLGPTATIMAYDLAGRGFQAIDIGQIALDYLNYMTVMTENPYLLYDPEYYPVKNTE